MAGPPSLSPEEWVRLSLLRKAADTWEPGADDKWARAATEAWPRIEEEHRALFAVAFVAAEFARALAHRQGEAAVGALAALVDGLASVGFEPGFRVAVEAGHVESAAAHSRAAYVKANPDGGAITLEAEAPTANAPGMPKRLAYESVKSYARRVVKWRALRPKGT